MDEFGVDMHLLSLTEPGVQMFDADTATELATLANDRLAETIARHPTRFAGLASFAPQSPKRAAKEMERAIGQLKLNGFVVNSHTNSEYLDDPKYWPILEAAEALDSCLYIHPRGPSDGMATPFRDYMIHGAMCGAMGSRPGPMPCGSSSPACSTVSPSSKSASAIWARRCISGCGASTS
jgi:2,3-dihydroxybenzoate decarboxylase/5-carboxyvanillate decarboxylase